jgi:hypothetical protein
VEQSKSPGAALYLQRRFGSAYLDGLSCDALHPVGCRIVLNDGPTLCLHTSKHIGSLSIATSQLDPAAGLFSEEPAYLVGQLQGRQAVLKSRRLRVILNLGVPSTRLQQSGKISPRPSAKVSGSRHGGVP